MLERVGHAATWLAGLALAVVLLLLPPLVTLVVLGPLALAAVAIVKPGSSRRVHGELDRALRESQARDLAADEKIVVFSDQHRGIRDGADDFQRCERCYVGALASYLERDYHLYVLGDAEELWECMPGEVAEAYEEALELEGQFASAGRYERFWGNHDVYWRSSQRFTAELGRSIVGSEPTWKCLERLSLETVSRKLEQ